MKPARAVGATAPSRQRARGALVVTQVALALVLLAGAGLTLKSFWNSQNAPLGFDPDGILTMTLSLPKRATIRMRRSRISTGN